MSDLEWKPAMSVGVPNLDSDHRNLIVLIARLEKAFDARDLAALAPLVRALYDETRRHFELEEALLREAGYPELAWHVPKHAFILRQIGQYHDEIMANRLGSVRSLILFLKTYFIGHVYKEDLLYKPYLRELAVVARRG